MSKICCFTGHRKIKKISPAILDKKLENVLVDLIENEGFTDFRAGGAMGFDTMAAACVLKLKTRYPHIKLHLILPCENQNKRFDAVTKRIYEYALKNADSVRYVSKKYYDGVMHVRNRALVDGSDACVAFMTELHGGTYYTVGYARKNKLEIINIAKL